MEVDQRRKSWIDRRERMAANCAVPAEEGGRDVDAKTMRMTRLSFACWHERVRRQPFEKTRSAGVVRAGVQDVANFRDQGSQ